MNINTQTGISQMKKWPKTYKEMVVMECSKQENDVDLKKMEDRSW